MPLIITWWALLLFWILAIYSVSIYESFQITLKLQHLWKVDNPSNYFYFWKQFLSLIISLITIFVISRIPLNYIQEHKNKIFIVWLIFLLLVFSPLWITFNWSTWWLYISWLWTIQPAEFFKICFVIFLAWWLLKKKKLLDNIKWFIAFLFVTWVFFFIFLMIPDLGTILVLWLVVLVMYRYAWWRIHFVLWLLIIWLFLWLTVWMQFDYIKKRLNYFFDADVDTSWRWVWWQIQQALVSIWWWWMFWNWYWKWLQKFWYIPEAQSDFVFAAFSEEIWLLWNSILLTLYFLLGYFFIKDLHKVRDEYYKILWVWLVSLIIMQVFVNVWVNTKILPLTWLTLPFISYGGSALMVNLIELTILYKILKEWIK